MRGRPGKSPLAGWVSLSALALKRLLGVSYPTAWLMQRKLMQAMVERGAYYVLEGQAQIDDVYLGGERTGGNAGLGSENKVVFVAAVSLDTAGHPGYVKMAPVPYLQIHSRPNSTRPQSGQCVVTSSDGLALVLRPSPWRDDRTKLGWHDGDSTVALP